VVRRPRVDRFIVGDAAAIAHRVNA
jgi:hypothetical protein